MAGLSTCLNIVTVDADRNSHYHLGKLHQCYNDTDESWHPDAHSSKCIITVHNRVNSVIHNHEPSTRGGVLSETVPYIHHNSDVMIPVQEDQLLLTKNNEQSVS